MTGPAHSRSALRRLASRVVRPFRTAYPDAGRAAVQGPYVRELLAAALKDVLPPRRVLNAGAGEGMYTITLLGLPGLQTLVEFDISYGGVARRPFDARQQLACASLTAIPLPDGWADLTICSEVLEHVEDDRAGLHELSRTLRPGGRLLLSVPTPPAPFDPNHVREGYRLDELERMFGREQLRIEQSRYCMRAAFKAILRWWRIVPWIPSPAMKTLTWAERRFPFGSPMDLIVLARRET